MRPSVRLLSSLAFALVVHAPRAQAQQPDQAPVPIALDDAVQRAQESSPLTVQARNATRVANAGVKTAFAAFLPSIGLSQSAGHLQGLAFVQGVLIPTGGGWNYNKGYGANLTVFDGGANILDYRAARANRAAAEQNEIIQRFQVALQVKQQYFGVLAAREAEAAAEQQLAEANEQMAVTNAKYAGGSASRADSLNSAVTVGQAKLAVLKARGQLVTANAALTQLVGGPQELTAMPADTALVPTISVDSAALLQLALNGPAARAAQEQVSANRSSWWASAAAYLPTLSVGYSHGNSYSSDHFIVGGGSPSRSNYTSLSLSYSLFGGFQRESRLIQAGAAEDNSRAQLRNARLTARENLATYLSQFRTAVQTIDLQRLQIEASLANVAGKEAQYAAGAVALVDVLTAQTALVQARQALIQARLDARTAKAQIEALIGRNID